MTISVDELKKKAGAYAATYVRSGMIVGLGAGSTARWALVKIAEMIRNGVIKGVQGVPCSLSVEKDAIDLNIPVAGDEISQIDLTIDGADEVNSSLDLIKGRGGALLREKIVAQASRRKVIVVDASKISSTLGTRPLPVEVSPFLLKSQTQYLQSLGATTRVRRNINGTVWLTDQRNIILDCEFGSIGHPRDLACLLDSRAGIIGHGLFIDLADEVIAAGESGIRIFRKMTTEYTDHD
jgi:ribose 5-phosphate isomerase A